jgi:DNA recombination protein Rad52
MSFTQDQIDSLTAPLDPRHVKERDAPGGVKLSYIEGWQAIKEANRIFGHGNWDRRTIMCDCVWQGERNTRGGKTLQAASYVARVEIVVHHEDGAMTRREGTGAGGGFGQDMGEAHESAIKEAETDAMKRALMTFGNPFGLALYDKDKTEVGAQQRQTGAKPVTGKYGITELKKQARQLAQDVRDAPDTGALLGLLNDKESRDVMNQLISDLPQWFYGDGGDSQGLKGLIDARKTELYEAEQKENA